MLELCTQSIKMNLPKREPKMAWFVLVLSVYLLWPYSSYGKGKMSGSR